MTVSLEQKKDLIGKYPIFSYLPPEELEKLARLFVEKIIPKDNAIVKEHELVDSIFIIVQGTAEVRENEQPIATLAEGETIGLSATSFFSETGKRTASVIATTDVIVLRLAIGALDNFIKQNPPSTMDFQNAAEIFTRMNFIKKAAPFAKLSVEQLKRIAEQIESVFYKSGDVIFNKGDHGDKFYLIESGRVDILNEGQVLASLKPPMVFGETALLMDVPRGAQAKCSKDSKLLAISRSLFLELIQSESKLASSIKHITKARNRPIRYPYIESSHHVNDDGENIVTLKDPKHGSYYQLADEGYFIWELLDGENTIRDLTLKFNKQFNIFDPELVVDFITELEDEGFVAKSVASLKLDASKTPWWVKGLSHIRNIMEFSFSFGNVDAWLTKSYNRCFFIFYTYPAKIIMPIIAIIGMIAFIYSFNTNVELFKSTLHSRWLLIFAISAYMATTILHELAHAYTTIYYGRKVLSFGIGWFWLGPVAFCDTSDMWLSKKEQRQIVDIAGLYLDLLLSATAILLSFLFHNPLIILFLWIFALYNYMSVFTNLSPIIELDGYYLLMDWLGKENLKKESIHWLSLKPWRHGFKLIKYHKAEFIYWIACLIYLILSIVIPFIVLNKLLYGIFGVVNPLYALIAPLSIATLSSITIWSEIRKSR